MKKLGFLFGFIAYYFIFARYVYAVTIDLKSSIATIGATDEFLVDVKLSINAADNTDYYLRGLFYKPGTSDYCGLTWNGTSWYSGPISPDGWKNFLKVTVNNNLWSGTLKTKIDTTDSACKTSGQYLFKIQRFTSTSSSGNIDSNQNELSLEVTVPTPTPTSAPSPTPTPTLTPSPTRKPTPTPTKSPTSAVIPTTKSVTYIPTPIQKTTPTLSASSQENASLSAEILGESTNSANPVFAPSDTPFPTPSRQVKVMGKSSYNWPLVFGLSTILAICGILSVQYWKKRSRQ